MRSGAGGPSGAPDAEAVQTRARTGTRTPFSRAAAVVPAYTSSAVTSAEMLRACQLSGVTVAAQVSVGSLLRGAWSR